MATSGGVVTGRPRVLPDVRDRGPLLPHRTRESLDAKLKTCFPENVWVTPRGADNAHETPDETSGMTKRRDTAGAPVPEPAAESGVYGISVAAELSGAAVQSLRLWERHGLLTPDRSDGGTRRYSPADLTRIARIIALVAEGVNIAGIGRILHLEDDNAALRAQVRRRAP